MWSTTLLLVLVNCFHIPSTADEVVWLPNKSIYLAKNFEDGQVPCPGQNIIFPETVEEGILISGLSINGLILPNDGSIVLDDGGIVFGADSNDNCKRVGNTTYINDSHGSWAQPDAWSNSRFNKATPDAERVPCYNDDVKFPNGSQFTVQLPDRTQRVRLIELNGRLISGRTIEERIATQTNDDSQQFIMSQPGMLKTVYDDPPALSCHWTSLGCPCQEFALNIDCQLKYCAPPRCSHPIKPEGHCCEICGASMIINTTKDFNMETFESLVSSVILRYGEEKFDYHYGVLPQPYNSAVHSDRVQVIVMDKGEYTGACSEVITEISYNMLEGSVKGKILLLSGSPVSNAGEGGKIVVIVFFLVLLTMGGMFGYYYRSSVLNLGDLRGGMTRGMISRLQRRTESVMSLARRDSTVSTATTAGTAFRNPMYSSMREIVQVAEPVTEE